MIKTVLAVSTGIIPPVTGVSRPHPLLRGGDAALRLPRTPEPWPDGTRIAGVSGMGPGINVHVVLRSEPSRGRHERKPRISPQAPRTTAGPAGGTAAGPMAGTAATTPAATTPAATARAPTGRAATPMTAAPAGLGGPAPPPPDPPPPPHRGALEPPPAPGRPPPP